MISHLLLVIIYEIHIVIARLPLLLLNIYSNQKTGLNFRTCRSAPSLRMRFQDSLILSAASAYTVAAASAPVLDGERIGRFTLELEPRAWRRETIVKRSESGDEEVVNIDDGINWATNVNLGGQDLRVQIDTGSADLWVISTGLDSETLKNNYSDNHVYDPSKSKTWSKIDTQLFNISYDVGEISASGDVGTESVNVGGATVTMRIGAATAVVGNVIDPGTDGIMGMGWAPNSSKSAPFTDALSSRANFLQFKPPTVSTRMEQLSWRLSRISLTSQSSQPISTGAARRACRLVSSTKIYILAI